MRKNALRVMWLLPLGSGSGPGQPRLLPASARAKPADSRQANIWEVRFQSVLGPEKSPGDVSGTERRASTCSSSQTSPELAGRPYFREFLRKRAAHRKYVRGRGFECHSVAELLSEHCCAEKCSTSHVAAASRLWERSRPATAAPSQCSAQAR